MGSAPSSPRPSPRLARSRSLSVSGKLAAFSPSRSVPASRHASRSGDFGSVVPQAGSYGGSVQSGLLGSVPSGTGTAGSFIMGQASSSSFGVGQRIGSTRVSKHELPCLVSSLLASLRQATSKVERVDGTVNLCKAQGAALEAALIHFGAHSAVLYEIDRAADKIEMLCRCFGTRDSRLPVAEDVQQVVIEALRDGGKTTSQSASWPMNKDLVAMAMDCQKALGMHHANCVILICKPQKPALGSTSAYYVLLLSRLPKDSPVGEWPAGSLKAATTWASVVIEHIVALSQSLTRSQAITSAAERKVNARITPATSEQDILNEASRSLRELCGARGCFIVTRATGRPRIVMACTASQKSDEYSSMCATVKAAAFAGDPRTESRTASRTASKKLPTLEVSCYDLEDNTASFIKQHAHHAPTGSGGSLEYRGEGSTRLVLIGASPVKEEDAAALAAAVSSAATAATRRASRINFDKLKLLLDLDGIRVSNDTTPHKLLDGICSVIQKKLRLQTCNLYLMDDDRGKEETSLILESRMKRRRSSTNLFKLKLASSNGIAVNPEYGTTTKTISTASSSTSSGDGPGSSAVMDTVAQLAWHHICAFRFRRPIPMGSSDDVLGKMSRRTDKDVPSAVKEVEDGDLVRFKTTAEELFGTPNAAIVVLMLEGDFLGVLTVSSEESIDHLTLEMLSTAASQLCSSIIQVMAFSSLFVRSRELEIIHKVDTLRTTPNMPILETLDRIAQCIVDGVGVRDCFIAVQEDVPVLKTATSPDLVDNKVLNSYIIDAMTRIGSTKPYKGAQATYTWSESDVAIMVQPLILPNTDEIVGYLGVLQMKMRNGSTFDDRPCSITDTQQALVRALASPIRSALHDALQNHRMREILSRSVDPKVMHTLLDQQHMLQTERRNVTVLFCDLRGSTALAESVEPEVFVEFANDYFACHTAVIMKYQGMLDKFVGDEIMAIFGAPMADSNHATSAVRAAVEMVQVHADLLKRWEPHGVYAECGIGISTGEAIVGEMGCRLRTDYTCMGRTINLGSRLCDLAKPKGIRISTATLEALDKTLELDIVEHQGVQVKGLKDLISIFEVNDASPAAAAPG